MTAIYLGAAIIAVVVDGVSAPSVPPAVLVHGTVLGPPQLVARFAFAVRIGPGAQLVAERAGRRCAQPERDGYGRVALAPLVRCLGGWAAWDGRGQTLSIAFAGPAVVATPAPFDPHAPQVAPTMVFTPEPAPPTPRAIDTGTPHPRRTAIPAVPSWPMTTTPPRR